MLGVAFKVPGAAGHISAAGWVSRMSRADQTAALATRGARIAEPEAAVQLLKASHAAMLRVVGELGRCSKWTKFSDDYWSISNQLSSLGALPVSNVHAIPPTPVPMGPSDGTGLRPIVLSGYHVYMAHERSSHHNLDSAHNRFAFTIPSI